MAKIRKAGKTRVWPAVLMGILFLGGLGLGYLFFAPATGVDPKPGQIHRDRLGPDLAFIPAGTFRMGLADGDNPGTATPVHDVTLTPGFWLAKFAVTRTEYAAFAADTGVRPPGECWTLEPGAGGQWVAGFHRDRDWKNPGFAQSDRDPVVCVNHKDATDYANWLSRQTGQRYRLPTETEWEYAARAGAVPPQYWGSTSSDACRFANVADRTLAARMTGVTLNPSMAFDCDDGFAFTAPVGSFAPNAWGLHDMLGNVWQWTADCWHDDYVGAPIDGRAWLTGDCGRRVARGGAWVTDPERTRTGWRIGNNAPYRSTFTGFRMAKSYEPK